MAPTPCKYSTTRDARCCGGFRGRRDSPGLLRACGPAEPEPHVGVLAAAATGSPQLGPLSTGLPHAEVPLSTVVAGVGGSAQGSPQPGESVGKGVVSARGWQQGAPRTEEDAPRSSQLLRPNQHASLPGTGPLSSLALHVALLCRRSKVLASHATEPCAGRRGRGPAGDDVRAELLPHAPPPSTAAPAAARSTAPAAGGHHPHACGTAPSEPGRQHAPCPRTPTPAPQTRAAASRNQTELNTANHTREETMETAHVCIQVTDGGFP